MQEYTREYLEEILSEEEKIFDKIIIWGNFMSKFFTILTSLILCIAIFVACGPKKNNSENTEPKSESVEKTESSESCSNEHSSFEEGTSSESEESVESEESTETEEPSESEESTETEKNSDSSSDKDSEVDYDDDKYWTNFY